jgi:hypothetical protein
MKLTFFLIAFFLVLLRVYFSWAGFDGHHGNHVGNMVIKGDNYIEEIHWSGKIRLSDDEKSITDITPGGYLEFRENDQTLKAESNLQGEISLTLFDGHNNLVSLDDSGRRFVAGALQKMITRGFDADGRAQRIEQRGGNRALLAELPHLAMEGLAEPYLDLLLKSDSLTKEEQIGVLKQIGDLGNDGEKEKYLNRFTPDQLKDSAIGQRWLTVAGSIGPDDRKRHLLMQYIGQVADSAGLPDNRWDSVMSAAGHIESDGEKEDLYRSLIDSGRKTDAEWISLIRSIGRMENDNNKSELLVQIAQKMPHNDIVKAEYKAAARTINDDMHYGKAMRAIE